MICEAHPNYHGKRKPRNHCITCLKMYIENIRRDWMKYDEIKEPEESAALIDWLYYMNAIIAKNKRILPIRETMTIKRVRKMKEEEVEDE